MKNEEIRSKAENVSERISIEELYIKAEVLSNSGSFVWDVKDNVTQYSAGVFRIFDVSSIETPMPKVIYSLLHPQDYEFFRNFLEKVLSGQMDELPALEFRIKLRNGQIRHIWSRISPEYTIEKEVLRITGVIRDVTEQKKQETLTEVIYNISRAASDLEHTHELFSLIHEEIKRLLDASNMFVAYYNEQSDLLEIQYVTGEADIKEVPAVGTMSKMVIVKNKALLIDERQMDEMEDRGEILRVGRDSKCWMGLPLRKNGKAFGIVTIQNYDLADAFDQDDLSLMEFICLQIESAIRKMEDAELISKLSNSVLHSPAAVVITDIRGIIEYVNPKFEEVTGYSFDEVIGKNPSLLNSGDNPPKMYVELWDTILKGKDWSGEFKNKRKDGGFYWEMASISSVKNKEGKLTHFIAVKEDITLRKIMEDDLILAKEKAEEANQLKSSFLANLSHEIRTPMNGILGFSELLRDTDTTPDDFNKYLKIIDNNGQQLMNIINDIITVANLEVNQLNLNNKEFDIFSLFQELESTLSLEQNTMGKSHIKLVFPDQLKEQNISLYTDRGKLMQVLVNLCRNALKFTDEGSIKLSWSVTNNELIRIDVLDTGIGVSQKLQEVVFERFRQADESSTRNFGGNGLGLAISRGLIELMGGRIWINSKVGEGSKFSFVIPVRVNDN
jgi:PAS domain S-box-containing protein